MSDLEPYPHRESFIKLASAYDIPVNEIGGFVGLTTASIRNLLTGGCLPAPIREPGRFFFAPTNGLIQSIYDDETRVAFLRSSEIGGFDGVNVAAFSAARGYAAMTDPDHYVKKILAIGSEYEFEVPFWDHLVAELATRRLFSGTLSSPKPVNSVESFAADDLFDIENGEGSFYHYAKEIREPALSDDEIIKLLKEARKYRGLILTLDLGKLLEIKDQIKFNGRVPSMQNGLYFEVNEGASIDLFRSIIHQCDASRAAVDGILDEIG